MKPLCLELDVLWRGKPVRLWESPAGWASTDPDLLILLDVYAQASWGARLRACTDDVLVDLVHQVADVLAVRSPGRLSLPASGLWG